MTLADASPNWRTQPVSQGELVEELADMRRLHELSTRLIEGTSLEPLLGEILDAAIDLLHAQQGLVQLCDRASGSCSLRVVVARGLTPEVVEKFRWSVPGFGACGAELKEKGRVMILDAPNDPAFSPVRDAVLEAGFRAVQATPLLSRDGHLLGIITTHFTEARLLTDRELRVLDLLARQAADFIERTQATEALRENDRRKDEFLATLAHELRNPLAPLRTALELARMKPSDPEASARVLDIMDRQLSNLVRLVDDLLDLSRVTRGKIELKREVVDVSRVLENAIETSRHRFETRKQRLELTLPKESLKVYGDPVRLAQIFSNLLNNASKYTAEGGNIHVALAREGAKAVVVVRDDGIGIEPQSLPHIFEMFVQERRGSTEGLGVGLTLARQLVVLHEGEIGAKSEGAGKGSEFTVSLPILDFVHSESAPSSEEPTAAPRRVLVVDDNRDAALMLGEALEDCGHSVRVAFDGESALRAAAELRPEVVLLDLGLPDIDGHEVARRLRLLVPEPRPMVVAITGWGQPEDRRRTLEAGFDRHLVKPVNLVTIREILTESQR
jgi:signal transduction histidine kinase/CheY-like chemotaxis protein